MKRDGKWDIVTGGGAFLYSEGKVKKNFFGKVGRGTIGALF